jgi:hypothetical protein
LGQIIKDPYDVDSWLEKYDRRSMIILYRVIPVEKTSACVARELMGMGYNKVASLKSG